MPSNDVIEVLGEWEGCRVGFVKRHPPGAEGSPAVLWIELIRRGNGPMICSGCGGRCDRYHDWEERWIRDLPILDAQTQLLVQRFRVACPKCGPRIKPLQHFARALRERIDGIFAHCQYPLHTSLLEGIMNKIKVIKRMAYGFRDDDDFFLKIRAAFPGNPG